MAEERLIGEEGRGDLGPQNGKRQKLDGSSVRRIAYLRKKVSFSAAHRLWRWVRMNHALPGAN